MRANGLQMGCIRHLSAAVDPVPGAYLCRSYPPNRCWSQVHTQENICGEVKKLYFCFEMIDKFTTRELEIYEDLIERLPKKRSAADNKLLQAFAVEMAMYEEATVHLRTRKVLTQGVKTEAASAWVAIRNGALKNVQTITKQLELSELAKHEEPTAHITKLEILKNGKKNIIQKAAIG
jgi:hypothetical protein